MISNPVIYVITWFTTHTEGWNERVKSLVFRRLQKTCENG